MNLGELSHYLELTFSGKISIDRMEDIFNNFYKNDFNYETFRDKYGNLADKIELFNEDLSRFEPSDLLRKEYPDYYIDKNQLMKIMKRFRADIDEKIKD